jgi:hypothetical protein
MSELELLAIYALVAAKFFMFGAIWASIRARRRAAQEGK